MARRRKREFWFMGPERHGKGWRVRMVDRDGAKTSFTSATKEEAEQVRRSLEREMVSSGELSIGDAISKYCEYLVKVKGNKRGSVDTTNARLLSFFGDLQSPISRLTEANCLARYVALQERGAAVDTHRNTLNQTKTFLNWCVIRKQLPRNPLKNIKGEGKRKHGKPQLRIDEARKWTEKAIELAAKGEAGAVAALVALFLGFRASEIINCQVRDLDNKGRMLWISDAKTEAGKRNVEIPAFMSKYMVEQARRKLPHAQLFVGDRHWVRRWVKKICELAEVPPVTAHGMRGLHSTLAVESGTTSHVVAASLGHESITTTLRSYAKSGSAEKAKQKKVVKMIKGGK